jgi:DNA-binding response OmpR family regulator
VLLIEDDPRIRQSLARLLGSSGYAVESTRTGMDGVERAASGAFEVVVLDLGLPDIDGEQVLKMIRAISDVPVIVATARDDEADIVRILDHGADDYVTKPFSAEQLEARIRAIRRRSATPGAEVIRVGGLEIDMGAHEATLDGAELDLTGREFELLAYLARNSGTMLGKREILAEVWRQPYGGADKTVDVHLSWLRRKLGETAAEPRYIHTKRGVGVKLLPPDE